MDLSICWETLNHGSHLLVRVYPEAAILGHACQLHVLGVKFFLHDLLQGFEYEGLGVGDGQRL